MKKHRLTTGAPETITALAIVTAEKDYRICFRLNKILDIDLSLHGSIMVDVPANGLVKVACYEYLDSSNNIAYFVARNRQDGFFIIPQLKQADLIFIINPVREASELERFKKALSGVSNIQSTFVVPGEQLKNIYIGE